VIAVEPRLHQNPLAAIDDAAANRADAPLPRMPASRAVMCFPTFFLSLAVLAWFRRGSRTL
jgi:hypothetical protein